MQDILKYKTVRSFNETTLRKKSSSFTAQVYPIKNEEEAAKNLEQIRKKYYDATHHCYAYKILPYKIKYSDDGEPTGTAGVRILNAINHYELQNILVIVIRYFGGIKLGAGPLGTAYYNSVIQTLENSSIIEKTGYKKILIEAGLNQINNIYHIIDQFKVKINKSDYSTDIRIECMTSCEKEQEFISSLNEISKGKIKTKIEENIIFL